MTKKLASGWSGHLLHVELPQQHSDQVLSDAVGGGDDMPGGDQGAPAQKLNLLVIYN